jgi:uncharacterized membrane protein YjgN (DUF898 family)
LIRYRTLDSWYHSCFLIWKNGIIIKWIIYGHMRFTWHIIDYRQVYDSFSSDSKFWFLVSILLAVLYIIILAICLVISEVLKSEIMCP